MDIKDQEEIDVSTLHPQAFIANSVITDAMTDFLLGKFDAIDGSQEGSSSTTQQTKKITYQIKEDSDQIDDMRPDLFTQFTSYYFAQPGGTIMITVDGKEIKVPTDNKYVKLKSVFDHDDVDGSESSTVDQKLDSYLEICHSNQSKIIQELSFNLEVGNSPDLQLFCPIFYGAQDITSKWFNLLTLKEEQYAEEFDYPQIPEDLIDQTRIGDTEITDVDVLENEPFINIQKNSIIAIVYAIEQDNVLAQNDVYHLLSDFVGPFRSNIPLIRVSTYYVSLNLIQAIHVINQKGYAHCDVRPRTIMLPKRNSADEQLYVLNETIQGITYNYKNYLFNIFAVERDEFKINKFNVVNNLKVGTLLYGFSYIYPNNQKTVKCKPAQFGYRSFDTLHSHLKSVQENLTDKADLYSLGLVIIQAEVQGLKGFKGFFDEWKQFQEQYNSNLQQSFIHEDVEKEMFNLTQEDLFAPYVKENQFEEDQLIWLKQVIENMQKYKKRLLYYLTNILGVKDEIKEDDVTTKLVVGHMKEQLPNLYLFVGSSLKVYFMTQILEAKKIQMRTDILELKRLIMNLFRYGQLIPTPGNEVDFDFKKLASVYSYLVRFIRMKTELNMKDEYYAIVEKMLEVAYVNRYTTEEALGQFQTFHATFELNVGGNLENLDKVWGVGDKDKLMSYMLSIFTDEED